MSILWVFFSISDSVVGCVSNVFGGLGSIFSFSFADIVDCSSISADKRT